MFWCQKITWDKECLHTIMSILLLYCILYLYSKHYIELFFKSRGNTTNFWSVPLEQWFSVLCGEKSDTNTDKMCHLLCKEKNSRNLLIQQTLLVLLPKVAVLKLFTLKWVCVGKWEVREWGVWNMRMSHSADSTDDVILPPTSPLHLPLLLFW